MNQPTIKQLQAENTQLKKKLNAQKAATQKANARWGRFSKRGTSMLLGSRLTESLRTVKNKTLSGTIPTSDDWIDVGAEVFYRLTRIGLFAIVIAVAPILILIMQTFLLNNQNKLLHHQNDKIESQNKLINKQNKRLDQQTYLQEADRRSSLVFLFSNVMDAIDRELTTDVGKKKVRDLTPQLIGRIISLSQRLKPYQYLEGDELISKPLSPERGQLLVNLIESQLDTATYGNIFKKADFSYADLRDNQFDDSVYLQNAKLLYADLQNSKLLYADLQNTKLWYANLHSANLCSANLQNSKLLYVDLQFCKLVSTNLQNANLQNAKLHSAKLYSANLQDASLRYANLQDTRLQEANLYSANLYSADLRDARLELTNLKDANLEDVLVHKNFLSETYIIGIENLKTKYKERTLNEDEIKKSNIKDPENYSILKEIK